MDSQPWVNLWGLAFLIWKMGSCLNRSGSESPGPQEVRFYSSSLSIRVKGQVTDNPLLPGTGHRSHPPRESRPTALTISAASGPGSSGRGPLKVSLDAGPAQAPLPLQSLQDITDGVHQVSHVALALRNKLQSTEDIREDTDLGRPCQESLPHPRFPGLRVMSMAV